MEAGRSTTKRDARYAAQNTPSSLPPLPFQVVILSLRS